MYYGIPTPLPDNYDDFIGRKYAKNVRIADIEVREREGENAAKGAGHACGARITIGTMNFYTAKLH